MVQFSCWYQQADSHQQPASRMQTGRLSNQQVESHATVTDLPATKARKRACSEIIPFKLGLDSSSERTSCFMIPPPRPCVLTVPAFANKSQHHLLDQLVCCTGRYCLHDQDSCQQTRHPVSRAALPRPEQRLLQRRRNQSSPPGAQRSQRTSLFSSPSHRNNQPNRM